MAHQLVREPTVANLLTCGEIIIRELILDQDNYNSWKRTQEEIRELGHLVRNYDSKKWEHYKEKFFKPGLS